MEYNLRDAVLCPALHWDTDIVSVGERHAQARAAAEFRSYRGTGGGLSKFGTYDLLPYRGGWAQAKDSTKLEPVICCLIAAVGHRRGFSEKRNP